MIRVSKDPNLLFQCNLAPPDGMRGCNGDDSDEIEESEEADRVRYKETLGQSWSQNEKSPELKKIGLEWS